jgi:rubrerythrin
MPKKTQKRNRRVKRKSLKTKRYTKKSIKKLFKRYKKGGQNEKVTCCVCEREVDKSNTLVPRACLIDHGRAAHRICDACWWNPESGFAREDADHRCPGCLKNLPLTSVEKNKSEVIDLTLDDE